MLKTTFRSNDYKAIDRLNYSTPGQLKAFYWLLFFAFLGIAFLFVKTFQTAAHEKTQVGKPVVMEER